MIIAVSCNISASGAIIPVAMVDAKPARVVNDDP
jgi:hypothetical protein